MIKERHIHTLTHKILVYQEIIVWDKHFIENCWIFFNVQNKFTLYSYLTGANPFGGTSASTQPSNPFGGAGGQPSLFGNQPNAGFGQQPGGFGNQPTSAAGFGVQTPMVGGFGTPTPAVGGFGGTQTSMAGGFGAPTSMAGGFGQPASNAGSFNMGGFGQTSQAGGFGQPVGGFGGAGMTNQLNNQNGAFSSIGPTNTSAGFGAFSQAQTVPNQFGHSMPGQFDNKMGGSQGFPSGWGGQPVATNSHTVNPFMVCVKY